jgi:hypothetical protein
MTFSAKIPPKMTPTEAKALLKELERRAGRVDGHVEEAHASLRPKGNSYKFMQAMHPKQRTFVTDKATLKAALCTRRAGKTTGAAYAIVHAAHEYDDALIPYVTITRENAQKVMWHELKLLNRRWQWGVTFNESTLTATFPNGSRVWLLGAKDKDDIERLRGSKYPLAVLDEAASFGPHIEELLLAVIIPALSDYDGTMLLIGTPGSIPNGLFFRVTTGAPGTEGWSVHKWTQQDNTFLPESARDLETIRGKLGLDVSDPRWRREYLGEWVLDDHSLVYKFSWGRNTYTALPENIDWNFCLGVDLGFEDDTAFVVGAYSEHSPVFYVVETYAEQHMDITSVAARVKALEERYVFSRKIVDAGALGKMIKEELASRHGVYLDPAEKKNKLGFIEQINSDFLMGRVLIPEGEEELINELTTLPWHPEKREEHPKYKNHRADALLYAWRDSRHYVGSTPEVDSRTREQIREDEYEARLARQYAEGEERPWYNVF